MEGLGNWLNFFKLRGSWGQNGNQNIEAFRYMATLTTEAGQYVFGPKEGELTTGIFPAKLPNEDLKWETSEQTDIGFDAFFLNNRLSANFDYYKKKTKDWLVEAPVLDIMGAGAPYVNAGNVTNEGLEFALGWNDKVGDLNYSINANVAYNENEVTYIGNATGFIPGGENLLYTNANYFFRAEAGYPIGYFYGLETAGIFQNAREIEEWGVQPDAEPGDIKFVDCSGPDGIPDGKIDQNDRTMIGDPNPDYTFGFSFSLEYKGADLSVTTNGALGHQIAMGFIHDFNGLRSNYHQVYLNRWHGEGTSNYWPRVTDNTEKNGNWKYINDLLIDDADYWKISTVTLGYDLNNLWSASPFQMLRVYVTGQNLYTFTDYLGMDPDVGFGVEDSAERKFSSGIDVGYYPHPRSFLFGVNVKF
jgi:TonB-linked SusC/RagA family outer membrane protein